MNAGNGPRRAGGPRDAARAAASSRREFLLRGGGGLGAVALTSLFQQSPLARALADAGPGVTRPGPHFAPRARSVIFIFLEGGPSHIDLFDPKPAINRHAGERVPESFLGNVILPMGESRSPILGCRREWRRHGAAGLWMSDWLPHLATCADDLAVIRSCWADGINHSSAICQMNTGATLAGRPSLGAWVSYGLGSENANLPAFVVMQDAPATVVNGPRNWGAGFMPATYQGTRLQGGGGEPIPHLFNPEGISADRQRGKLGLLADLNRQHSAEHPGQSELDARINAYELAFRMQAEAPEAVDLTRETAATRELYGLENRDTEKFGRLCLLGRRLVERGVRFVQLYHGAGNRWDAHERIEKNHSELCRGMDQPVAGLLKDLKARGLLDSTLVVWGGEFGRTPQSEKGDGRDHNPYGFTMWMAGGGIRPGLTLGSTDEFGLHAVEDRLHVHDLHATILHQLGLDNFGLMYRYKGRPERPTLNEGEVCRKLLA